jgi:hypothetical protein
MKTIYRLLGAFFAVYIGKVFLGLFQKKPNNSSQTFFSKAEGQPRYSKHSKRLWEDSPRCRGIQSNEFEYRGEFKNIKGEPVFYVGRQGLTRIFPTFKRGGGIVKPKIDGFFNAHPGGLDIDQYTGEIDVNESDTGIRYVVEYTPCGKRCVTSSNVVISGIGYEGGIVSLSQSGPEEYIVKPHYFGSTADQFCGVPSKQAPPGNYISREEKDQSPTPGLVVDFRTGAVNLKETISKGALGFSRNGDYPENGTCKKFSIYYSLDSGPSQGIVNKTSLRLHFYNSKADIPDELLVRISQQNNSIYRNSLSLPLLLGIGMTSISSLQDIPWEGVAALLAALTSFLFATTTSDNPCRPPEKIIVI